MAEPTLLSDVIVPAWHSLTPEQRTCWHFYAQANPVTDELGRLRVLYGHQMHYKTNAAIATAETEPLITHPPADKAKPPLVTLNAATWPLQAISSGDVLHRRGLAYIDFVEALPSGTLVIIRQGYALAKPRKGRPPRARHVTVVPPLATGAVDLADPTGYFATTAGLNRFAKITGRTARRRPDKPLGSARIINLLNGQEVRVAIPNPWGGSRKKTNRPRATQVKPTAGDHYP